MKGLIKKLFCLILAFVIIGSSIPNTVHAVSFVTLNEDTWTKGAVKDSVKDSEYYKDIFEDFYTITVKETGTMTVTLDYSGKDAVSMYLCNYVGDDEWYSQESAFDNTYYYDGIGFKNAGTITQMVAPDTYVVGVYGPKDITYKIKYTFTPAGNDEEEPNNSAGLALDLKK